MNRFQLWVAAATVTVLAATDGRARGDAVVPPQLQNVGFDQRLGEQTPFDTAFVDESGRPVRLGQYFHGKPVILVMAYYRCPMLCTLVLNGLVQGMLDMNFNVGQEFEVVTVSFDPRETPDLAAAKKETYVGRYGRAGRRGGLALFHRQGRFDPAIGEAPSVFATNTTQPPINTPMPRES